MPVQFQTIDTPTSSEPLQRPKFISTVRDIPSSAREESELNPIAAGLFSALKFIDRPRSAVVGAITGDEGSAGRGIRGEEQPLFGDYIFNKIDEARFDPNGNSVLKWVGSSPELTGAVSAVGGIIGDIALDPITYVGTPLATLSKKLGLGTATKAVTAPVKRAVDKTVELTQQTPVGDQLWSMLSTKHNLRKYGDFADMEATAKDTIRLAQQNAVENAKTLRQNIDKIAISSGIPRKSVEQFITESVERGGVVNVRLNTISDEAKDLLIRDHRVHKIVNDIGLTNTEQLMKEINAGIKISAFKQADNAGITLDYMTHAITPDAQAKVVKKYKNNFGKVYNEKHASTLQRKEKWRDYTISDINKLAKEGKLPGYEGQVFKDGFFYEDPALIQAIRDSRHKKAMAVVDLMTESKNKFGMAAPTIKEMAIKNGAPANINQSSALQFLKDQGLVDQNLTYAKHHLVAGYAFPEEIAKRLDETYNVMMNPEKLNIFLKAADDITNWWKSWTLSIFPSYHFRNEVGNVWNNFVSGVHDPRVYSTANKIQTGKAGYVKAPALEGGRISHEEIMKHMNELGVRNRGFMATDIESSLAAELGHGKWATLSTNNKALQMGRRLGEAFENNARMANFIDGIQKGMTLDEAAKRVKHTLFDYADLTPFEQKIMKRIMPFYTWSRKNIPFQIQGMIRNPGKYKAIDTIRTQMEAHTEQPDEKLLADWMLTNYPIRVGIDEEGRPKYFMLGNWIPAADVWKLVADPISKETGGLPVPKLALDLLHPIPKTMLESMMEKSLFSGKVLDDTMEDFVGLRVSAKTKNMLKNLRLLSEIDNFMASIDYQYPELAEDLGISRTKPMQDSDVGKRTLGESLINFMSGIRTYTVDYEKQRLFQLYEQRKEIKKLKKQERKQIYKGYADGELFDIHKRIIEQSGGKVENQSDVINFLENMIEGTGEFLIPSAGASTRPQSGFDEAIGPLLEAEGGSKLTNKKNDRGGLTKYGISKKANPNVDIKNLTEDQAKAIYKEKYWDKIKGDQLPPATAGVMFNIAVNSGNSQAIKHLQRSIGTKADGRIGSKTLGAIDPKKDKEIARSIINEQRKLYKLIIKKYPNQKQFEQGWENRMKELERRYLYS